jgi:response regulator of citrate/malate metabolism
MKETMHILLVEDNAGDILLTRECPDLILPDINLPKINGLKVPEQVKHNTKLKHIQANSYITKPVELEKFPDAMRSFGTFWCSIVQLPPVCP